MDKTMDKAETRVTQLASATIRRAPMLGRKITRRLSLVTRVPSLLVNRNYQVTGSRESIRIRPPRPRKVRSFHVTVVLPDESQRTVSTCPPPLLLKRCYFAIYVCTMVPCALCVSVK